MKIYKSIKLTLVLMTGGLFLMGDICCVPPPLTGYLVDSPIKGVTYTCNENEESALTDNRGAYHCSTSTVSFSIGLLELGNDYGFTEDSYIYPQDLVGVSRENFTDERLILLTRFLQSLDDDGNISVNINITKEVSDSFDISQFSDLTEADIEVLLTDINKSFVSEKDAMAHLKNSLNEHNTTQVYY